jgi:hypothetical protein
LQAYSLKLYSPQSRHEGMRGKKLVICASVGLRPNDIGEESYKDAQSDSDFTKLLNDALRCAIKPSRHDAVVHPPDTEDTTHGLQEIEHKKGELSRRFNEPSKEQREDR